MEPGAGRRDYDRQIDPVIEMYVEERLRDTRHELRQDIAVLATNQAASALQATKEHGEVQADIRAMRSDVVALRHDVAELTPLRDSVAALRHRDEIDEARAETARNLLDEVRKQRTQFRNLTLGVMTIVVAAASVIVAVLN